MKLSSLFAAILAIASTGLAHAQSKSSRGLPVSTSIYDRTRVVTSQWFAAPPESETYIYVESLVRLGVAQRVRHWDCWAWRPLADFRCGAAM
jgi:hypothetical protein